MSEFKVEVVRIGEIEKHPNADTLSLTKIHGGYPVIIRTGEFQPGDRAVYLPIDCMLPTDSPRFAFLKEEGKTRHRLKAKRLRGIFSMGLLIPAEEAWQEGQDLRETLGITKYEPPLELMTTGGEDEPDPGFLPAYTDIEGLRRHLAILEEGEEVVLTEKVHGANGRFLYHEGRLWVGSRGNIKRRDPRSIWWRAAEQSELERRLADFPGLAIYGEVYGQVQDLQYGKKGVDLILFDAQDVRTRRYLDYDDFLALAEKLALPVVPLMHRGPWSLSLMSYAEGKTLVPGASNVREGFVVRPVKERFHPALRRVILKLIGEGYLLRRGA